MMGDSLKFSKMSSLNKMTTNRTSIPSGETRILPFCKYLPLLTKYQVKRLQQFSSRTKKRKETKILKMDKMMHKNKKKNFSMKMIT